MIFKLDVLVDFFLGVFNYLFFVSNVVKFCFSIFLILYIYYLFLVYIFIFIVFYNYWNKSFVFV